jgi:hypothetical protein
MTRKIKVSHEVPFCLLIDSLRFNDYQYALPHLLDENQEYADFFKQYKAKGGYIIMDNSLHELGTAYNSDRLWYWIKELEPDEFIVPDVWEDKNASIVNAREWIKYSYPTNTIPVAVVQAKSIHEAIECTQTYKDLGYKKIAYSYGASYYNKVCPHPNVHIGKALGRINVISVLYNEGILTPTDRVHLLGCQIPQEFKWYEGIECIESIDTSNPIMAALENTYYESYGLNTKPKTNMNESQNININDVNLGLIKYNVNMFRTINNL